jgi:glycerol-1-phosphate dehydrogenase [NAD(P)+]
MPAAEPPPPGDALALLLAGEYPDPESGARLRAETRSLVVADRLDGAEAELVAALGAGRRVLVLSDVDTAAAMGARVERALAARFTVQSIVLERRPQCDVETAERLLAAAEPVTDLVVAVGSGTINDLAKLVAHRRAIPQVVFATAPSMNGYTSVSSSVLDGGVKRSVRTATPAGAFFDLRVLAAAPRRLIRAGVGDSACRSTAQVDWLLAHLLLGRPYREAPFSLLAADEDALLAEPEALVAGDVAAMRHLVRTLVLSGFGMTLCGGSYPASQGEHLLAHYLTMMRPHALDGPLHGEEIGVCTLVMAALQDDVLARDRPPVLRASTVTRDEVRARYGAVAGETCWTEVAPKLIDDERAEALNARLAAQWPAIRARLAAVSLPGARLRDVLAAVGAPIAPAELGWSDDEVLLARRHAREIRDRYTFLDLVADSQPE